jgi:DNA repair protein RadC
MVLLRQERLRTLLLNSKNEVVGTEDVYQGTVNAAQVRIAEVLRPAIRDNCPSIIVVHNHPSGDPAPSPEDVLVTRRINQSAESMDIKLLDHIVIGERGFVSMKSRNLGF